MNRKKNGKTKKRIKASPLSPYKRVNVCVPLDVYRYFEKNNPNHEQIGAIIRRTLIGVVANAYGFTESAKTGAMARGKLLAPVDKRTLKSMASDAQRMDESYGR